MQLVNEMRLWESQRTSRFTTWCTKYSTANTPFSTDIHFFHSIHHVYRSKWHAYILCMIVKLAYIEIPYQ